MNVASITRSLRGPYAGRSRSARASFALPMIASLTMSAATVAAADPTKIQCVAANTKGQDLRRDGHFSAAIDQFTLCAASSCPALVRDDCARRLDDLERAQPSLVLDVKDAYGADVVKVRVRVDGQTLVDSLDGSALKIDPGEHTLTLETALSPVVVLPILIREGEKSRHERVMIETVRSTERAAPSPAAPPSAEPAALAPTTTPTRGRGLTTEATIALSLAAGGVVGLGVGSVSGALAVSAWNNAKAACGGNPSRCTALSSASPYHDQAQAESLISTIGFIAGGALVATGLVVYFHSRSERPAGSPMIALTPSAGPGQAGLVAHGSFW